MNYFNYFEKYQKAQKGGKSTIIGVVVLVAIALIAFGGYYLSLVVQRNFYQNKLDYLSELSGNPQFRAQQNDLSKLEKDIKAFEDNYMFLRFGDLLGSGEISTVSDKVLNDLDACLVPGAYLTSINLDSRNLNIVGHADTLSDIIEIETALRASGNYSHILVSTTKKVGIEDEVERVEFDISLTLASQAAEEEAEETETVQ